MPIGLDGILTKECQKIKKGTLFRLFSAPCQASSPLKRLPSNPYKKRIPHVALRDSYISAQKAQHVEVCNDKPLTDPKTFAALKHTMLRMSVRIPKKCPFDLRPEMPYILTMNYTEALTPAQYNDAPPKTFSGTLSHENPSASGTYVSNECAIISDYHASFGSTRTGTVKMTLEFIDMDPTNPCGLSYFNIKFELVSLGRDYDLVYGGASARETNLSCQGGNFPGYWTGVSYAMGPFGLVMSVSYDFKLG